MSSTMDSDPDIQPPFAELMGMKITQVSRDKVMAELFVRDELENSLGVLHGGAIMGFADNLGGTATLANLPRRRTHGDHREQDQFLCSDSDWRHCTR